MWNRPVNAMSGPGGHPARATSHTGREGLSLIAPFPTDSGRVAQATSLDTVKFSDSVYKCPYAALKKPNSLNLVFNTNSTPPFDNFYLSDVTTRSPITMGKCASQFKTNNSIRFSSQAPQGGQARGLRPSAHFYCNGAIRSTLRGQCARNHRARCAINARASCPSAMCVHARTNHNLL